MAEAIQFAKGGGALHPADDWAREEFAKMGDGEIVLIQLRRLRNPKLHRKYFALLKIAYDLWTPQAAEVAGLPARKDFDGFREDVIIAAGYYRVVVGLDGVPRPKAKSINWRSMDQAEFEGLYESTVAVLTAGSIQGFSREDAERVAREVDQGGF